MNKIKLTVMLILASSMWISAQEFQPNRVVAHRGAWKADKLPENSIASFKKAIELGCAGSEFDVYLTADSVLVLNHDTDLQGLSVEKSTLAQLKQKKLSNGETVALLDDILKILIKQENTVAFLEIKPSAVSKEHGFAAVDKILEAVERHNAEDKIFYISFEYSYLQRIKEKRPQASMSFLSSTQTNDIGLDKKIGMDFNYKLLNANTDMIRKAKNKGISINVWTVNDPKNMKYFLEQNIDYITTDEPVLLLELEKEYIENLK
ncbi:MAG: glycerophosphodiester phosphodiesterase [Prevotellaceae bacterium]|jgi:glycerophosphoryl diester phosphodiesterase|nr:glycerophosphodiester phosphodiesterase [Prevotellaceae bacterium]